MKGECNANYRNGYNTGADFTDGIDSLNDYTAWRSPQVSAFDATYGAPGNSTLGELGNIGGMIGGGLAHLAFDTTTDTIGMGITSAHFYIDPIGAGKDLLNGNTLGGQFSIGTQNWIDSTINNTGANPFAGGFGNEQMKDGFEIGFGAASLGMGGIGAGIKGGGKVDDINSSIRLDYSPTFTDDLVNFNPNYQHFSGQLDNDLILVQFHRSDRELGEGRSAAWWTSTSQANELRTIDDIRQYLALPPVWGPRDAVSIAKVPKGSNVEFFEGTAARQNSNGVLFEGDGVQFRFKEFDRDWIIDTRKIPSVTNE